MVPPVLMNSFKLMFDLHFHLLLTTTKSQATPWVVRGSGVLRHAFCAPGKSNESLRAALFEISVGERISTSLHAVEYLEALWRLYEPQIKAKVPTPCEELCFYWLLGPSWYVVSHLAHNFYNPRTRRIPLREAYVRATTWVPNNMLAPNIQVAPKTSGKLKGGGSRRGTCYYIRLPGMPLRYGASSECNSQVIYLQGSWHVLFKCSIDRFLLTGVGKQVAQVFPWLCPETLADVPHRLAPSRAYGYTQPQKKAAYMHI